MGTTPLFIRTALHEPPLEISSKLQMQRACTQHYEQNCLAVMYATAGRAAAADEGGGWSGGGTDQRNR